MSFFGFFSRFLAFFCWFDYLYSLKIDYLYLEIKGALTSMEMLMQYIWEYRLWNPSTLSTNDGRRVRIIDPGRRNRDAGPDFFNAKIDIDGTTWVGNVEIHYRASDWHRHGHDRDKAYDSVILHVVDKDDAPVYRSDGQLIPQMVMHCSPHFNERYAQLVGAPAELPCKAQIRALDSVGVAEWVQAMSLERLIAKGRRVEALYEAFRGNWEQICFVTFARNLGFGTNSDAFELLAKSVPLQLMHKHSDSLFQLEALLFGQSGLLDGPNPGGDAYFDQLAREYAFLRTKYSLRRADGMVWKSFRMRPQNFPWRRIALLAHYVEGGFRLMGELLEADSEEALRRLFTVSLSGYWSTHYNFSHPTAECGAAISKSMIDVILINTVAPLYYVYGTKTGNYELVQRAIDLLEGLRPESNRVVNLFVAAGMKVDSALASQAVLQIYNEYCLQRKCLFCRIGRKILRAANSE